MDDGRVWRVRSYPQGCVLHSAETYALADAWRQENCEASVIVPEWPGDDVPMVDGFGPQGVGGRNHPYRVLRRAAGVGGILVAAFGFAMFHAEPARADDASFQSDLAQNHVGVGFMNPPTVVALGHFMCDRMREGMSPGDAAQLPRGPFIDGMGIATTAQRDLCPDTLH